MKAKFEISELLGIGMTLVVLGIGLAYGLSVMTDTGDDMGAAGCASYNTTIITKYTMFYNTSARICENATGSQAAVVGSAGYNSTDFAIKGVGTIPEKLPTIATVIVAAVIIGILVTYLWGRFQQ
jgi:hypothetical protein